MCDDAPHRQDQIDRNGVKKIHYTRVHESAALKKYTECENGGSGPKAKGRMLAVLTEETFSSRGSLVVTKSAEIGAPVSTLLETEKIPRQNSFDYDDDVDDEDNDDANVEKTAEIGASEFDPYEYAEKKNPTSYWGTAMHMLIVAISPTLLNLPYTFGQVGYAVGAAGSFCTVMLYAYCMHMVVDGEYALCRRLRRAKMSYTQLVYHAFDAGPQRLRWLAAYARTAVYAALICVWAGGNAIYVLLIGDNLRSASLYYFQYDLSVRAVILCLVVPLVLLCWIPNLKLMVFYSAFSNTVNVCCIIVILVATLQDLPSLETRHAVVDLAKIPYFLGVIFVTINSTGLLISLKNQMRNPRLLTSRTGVLNVSYAATGILYMVFGFLCYLKHGADVKNNVILNLPNNPFTNAVKLFYALAVIFFYPLVSYVTFDIVWNELARKRLKVKKKAHEKALEYGAKTLSALSSIVLAFVFPNVTIFVSLTGTVCASLDSVIAPAVVNLLVHRGEKGAAVRVPKNICIIGLGILLAVFGLADACRELGDFYKKR